MELLASTVDGLGTFGKPDDRRFIRQALTYYRENRGCEEPTPVLTWVEQLITAYTAHTRAYGTPDEIEQHNAFILFYRFHKTLPEIAEQQHIHKRTVSFQVDRAIDRILILAFGINGIKE